MVERLVSRWSHETRRRANHPQTWLAMIPPISSQNLLVACLPIDCNCNESVWRPQPTPKSLVPPREGGLHPPPGSGRSKGVGVWLFQPQTHLSFNEEDLFVYSMDLPMIRDNSKYVCAVGVFFSSSHGYQITSRKQSSTVHRSQIQGIAGSKSVWPGGRGCLCLVRQGSVVTDEAGTASRLQAR